MGSHLSWVFGRGVGLRFAGALLVLCTVGGISVWSTMRFTAAARDRQASFELRERLATLFAELQDAETGQRGYLLTGREADLGPLVAGSTAVTRDLELLRHQVAHDSLQAIQIAALAPLIDAKLAELVRATNLRRRGALTATREAIARNTGKRLTDGIRTTIARINALEETRTVHTDARVAMLGTLALIVAAVGSLLAVALVLAALDRIGRSMAAQAHADAALRMAEARLQRVTASGTAVLYTGTCIDQQFLPTWVSDNIARVTGYDRDDALHAAWWIDHVHPDDRALVLGKMSGLSASGQIAMEYRFQDPHGAWRWVRDEARLVADAAGHPTQLFGAWVDVTERRRSDEALQRYAAELAAANAELDAFVHAVSHDLRAPLRSIDEFSQALAGDRGHLDRIRGATQRMAQLIDDLLELSRVTRTELRRGPVDLSALAREIADELRLVDPGRDVMITITPDLLAEGDTPLLRVALENLLGNAWKYTGKRDKAEITFGAYRHNGSMAYYVRDNGAGFDMQDAHKLFGAFQRLHPEAEFGGTGIGLATVRRIIHRHGGRVWAEGVVGKGASFYFTL